MKSKDKEWCLFYHQESIFNFVNLVHVVKVFLDSIGFSFFSVLVSLRNQQTFSFTALNIHNILLFYFRESYFKINGVTGNIDLAKQLDREQLGTSDNISLAVLAEDRGSPPMNSSCVVFIKVDDINDHRPEFCDYGQELTFTFNEGDVNQNFYTAKVSWEFVSCSAAKYSCYVEYTYTRLSIWMLRIVHYSIIKTCFLL